MSALSILDGMISDLEASLFEGNASTDPTAPTTSTTSTALPAPPAVAAAAGDSKKKKAAQPKREKAPKNGTPVDPNFPTICQIEFKVGVITKVWEHPVSYSVLSQSSSSRARYM
jgi:hypothetical protein